MSHNKILRTVFGISTGALLFGMNMMQVPFASENITETEPQSISEENTDVIDNQKLLEIDQDQLDTGVVYVTTKDTYFYFPDGFWDGQLNGCTKLGIKTQKMTLMFLQRFL